MMVVKYNSFILNPGLQHQYFLISVQLGIGILIDQFQWLNFFLHFINFVISIKACCHKFQSLAKNSFSPYRFAIICVSLSALIFLLKENTWSLFTFPIPFIISATDKTEKVRRKGPKKIIQLPTSVLISSLRRASAWKILIWMWSI